MLKDKRPAALEDFYRFKYVSTPDFHADSGQLAYVVSQGEKLRHIQRVILRDMATGTERHITAGGYAETNPRISPDGSKLLFLSNATGDDQIWAADILSGECTRVTSMRYGVSEPVWSPDGARIAFLSANPDGEEDIVQTMRDPQLVVAEEKKRRNEPMATESFGYKSDANKGFAAAVHPTHLWVLTLGEIEAKCLTDKDKNHVMPVWSPDGKTILVASNRERSAQEYIGMDLFAIPSNGGEITQLSKGIWIAHYPKKIVPRYTPDGKTIVFGGLVLTGEGMPPCYLYAMPAAGGEAVRLMDENAPCDGATRFLYNAERYGGSYETMQIDEAGEFAYFISCRHGAGNIYRVNLAGEPVVQQITREKANFASLTEIRGGNCVVIKCDSVSPEEMFHLNLETLEQYSIVNLNPWLDEVDISPMEEMWIDSLDGKTRIQGWVVKPPYAKHNEKYPAALYIHGGPTPYYGYALCYEHQYMAALGVGVILVNPRGSSSYGAAHGQVHQAFDGTAYTDLLQFVDAALREYTWIDPRRLGICGGSYGGYMTNWIAAHTKRFKAAVTQRSVVNHLISYASSDMGANGEAKKAASFEEWMLKKLETSPITYSDNIDIPFLILHPEQDMRCPVEGAHQLYVAVKDQHPDLPVRLVVFPDSSHNSLGRGLCLQLIHHKENAEWLSKHLQQGC
jgi:dipeptidyl aminopeptidase/acylaminoacyl peptidase